MLGLCKGGKTYPATIFSHKSGSWYLHFRYLKFLVIRGFLRGAWLKDGKWTNERNESMLIYLWKWCHLGCCVFFCPPWFATLFPNGIFLHHFDGITPSTMVGFLVFGEILIHPKTCQFLDTEHVWTLRSCILNAYGLPFWDGEFT